MKNKLCIEIAGIKQNPVEYTTSHGTAIITTYYTHKAQGRDVYACQINGKDMLISADNRPDLVQMVEANRADYKARFEARYPGIYDLVAAINADKNHYEGTQRMMEDEDNDGVRPPKAPKLSADQARQQYPIAAAYLDILRFYNADPSSDIGFNRRQFGKAAFIAIEAGADVIEQLDIIRTKEASYVSPAN